MDFKKAFVLVLALCGLASQPAMAGFCIGKACFGQKEAEAATKEKPPAAEPAKPVAKKPAHVTIWKARSKHVKRQHHHLTHEQVAAKNSNKRALRYLSHDLNNIRYTGDADVDFASAMLPTQQGALELAKAQLIFGKDPEMKDLAMRTIIWQEANIGTMREWASGRRSDWRDEDVHDRQSVRAYKNAVQSMRCGLKVRYTGNADVDFARTLLPHHQGAMDIAWIQQQYGSDRTMRNMASDIIQTDSEEIRWINNWLADKHHQTTKP